MVSDLLRRLRIIVCSGAILAFPVFGHAQEATIAGTVTDTTGAVLPGATVTAVHEASGNTFLAVTDERGNFRIGARVGSYRLTVELQGFTTLTRSGLALLVGQTADLTLQMAVTGVAESVTVTGEAPLIDTTQSSVSSNIDPRQMSELPVQGREWTTLALLAPGNRTNAIGETPIEDRGDVREFQLNMDGQQVTNMLGPGGQPRFSRDAIAEFQFISNRFDATQGRSSGVQVNAITQSGANQFAGSFGGYFRDSRWNAEDPVLNRVLPGSEQQYSTTAGGPILRDRLHFFANHEYDRSPRTTVANTAFPLFNVSLSGTQTTRLTGLRLDYQLSPQNRLMLKGNMSRFWRPFSDLGSNHPAGSGTFEQKTANLVAQLTQVLGNRALNEIKLGGANFWFQEKNLTTWTSHPRAGEGITNGHPRIQLTGFNVAGNANWPRYWTQDIWSVRDDFTFSYNARGRHDLKAGGELLYDKKVSFNCSTCMGQIDARGGLLPANLQALLPDVWNADTWNLNALAPITRAVVIGVSDQFRIPFNQPKTAAWIQDDWTVTNRLTLNLGLRYDFIQNATNQENVHEPWMKADRPQDADNIQPRLGLAYKLDDRTVLRGGAGKYYPDIIASQWSHSTRINTLFFLRVENDGRSDFVTNPFNGPVPSYQQALGRLCNINPVPGCIFRDAEELAPPSEYSGMAHSWQFSGGVARQVWTDMAVEVDYVHNRSRHEKVLHDNANLSYNPATGANFPFSNRAARPYPNWGAVGYYAFTGMSDYHALQTSFTKRFSNRWQASANYTLAIIKNDEPSLPISGHAIVPFPVAPDLGGEWGLAATDQRHRAVFNGIWQVGAGFQVSGLYFYGAGQRLETSCGGDRRDIGRGGTARLCANGSIVPRNSFVQDSLHRVDARFQQRIPLGGRARLDGILELFNLFDRTNYGSFVTDRSSPRYGLPNASSNLAYAPRTVQTGFRLTF